MRRLLQYELPDGGYVVVEAEDFGTAPIPAGAEQGVERLKVSFQRALDVIKPVTDILAEKVRQLANQPDEVSIEFGVKLTAKAGAIIAVAGTEANFTVKCSWKSRAN
jgi:hypothetical protein